jgi:hypothetical protein
MTVHLPGSKKRPVRQAPAPLKLDDVDVTPNGARPRVTLVLSRPLTAYEARVVWESFPLASGSKGSTKITLRASRTPPSRAHLEKDVARISQRAAALERQDQRRLGQFEDAVKERFQAVAKVVKKLWYRFAGVNVDRSGPPG